MFLLPWEEEMQSFDRNRKALHLYAGPQKIKSDSLFQKSVTPIPFIHSTYYYSTFFISFHCKQVINIILIIF